MDPNRSPPPAPWLASAPARHCSVAGSSRRPTRASGFPGIVAERSDPALDHTGRAARHRSHRALVHPDLQGHLVLRRPDRLLARQPRLVPRFHPSQTLPGESPTRSAALPHHQWDEHVHAEPGIPAGKILLRVWRGAGGHLPQERNTGPETGRDPRILGRLLSLRRQSDGYSDPSLPLGAGRVSQSGWPSLIFVRPGAGRRRTRGSSQFRASLSRRIRILHRGRSRRARGELRSWRTRRRR